MTKKIFLITFMVVLLACLFVITTSAAEIPEWTDTITYETGENAIAYKEGFDTTSRVMLENGDGTYSTYPANYIIKGNDDVFSANELDFGNLKTASGNTTYTNASIVRFEMPKGFKSVEGSTFRLTTGLKPTSMLTIKIPEGVTSFGGYMFYNNNVVVEVELPDTLETIEGQETFIKATSLKSISIPASLTSIPKQAFNQCTALEEVDFSKCTSLKTIGDSAFHGCTKLTAVSIPEGVETMKVYAFFGCSALTYVSIPSTVTTMGGNMFENCTSMQTVVCKAQAVGDKMLTGCKTVTSLTLENTKTIGEYAFFNCKGITSVTIPEGVTSIGSCAFYGCTALTSAYVPSTVTTMGEKVFEACSELQTVVCKAQVLGGRMLYLCNKITSLTLENTVTVGAHAFYQAGPKGFVSGTTLVFPETLTTIEKNAFDYFYFETITLPKTLVSVDSTAFTTGNYLKKILFTGTEEQASSLIGTAKAYELVNHCAVYHNNEHVFDKTTYLFTSFVEESYVDGNCSTCGLEGARTVVEPIFYGFGYAKRIEKAESNERAMVFSYFINKESLEVYQSYNKGEAIGYGVIAVFESKLANGESIINPLDASGQRVNQNVMNCDLTGKGLTSIDLLIKGDTSIWESVASAPIYMASYVKTSDGIFYLGNQNKEAHQSANIADIDTKTYAELFA